MHAALDRARLLAFAGQEVAARDLLLSLIPEIQRADRDDWMLEVTAQIGEIFLVRGAPDRTADCARDITNTLQTYADVLAGRRPDLVGPGLPELTLTPEEVETMTRRYTSWAHYLASGVAAAQGDHEEAQEALDRLVATPRTEADLPDADNADEHRYQVALARLRCAEALCHDDRHAAAMPLWEQVLNDVDRVTTAPFADRLLVSAGLAYGAFCVEIGLLSQAEPWLRRAGARAQAQGWPLDAARADLERAAASWASGDLVATERLVTEAYPVIAEHARAHDVSRSWFHLGLVRLATGALDEADECWEHAERHWRELDRPGHLYRILLQRSWVPIFAGRFAEAVEVIAQARDVLDAWPRSTWLQYARLDYQLGSVWRADALAELGFDPQDRLGLVHAEEGTPAFDRAARKLDQAADLMVPAALAVDAERYAIADPALRAQWARRVSSAMLAGAFAVAWEGGNVALTAELIEYHSIRGAFTAEAPAPAGSAATDYLIAVLPEPGQEHASNDQRLTRLGPAPPLQMEPGGPPILQRYRELAAARYRRAVTAAEPAWRTWS